MLRKALIEFNCPLKDSKTDPCPYCGDELTAQCKGCIKDQFSWDAATPIIKIKTVIVF